MNEFLNEALEKITSQQPKERTPVWMVGEQLKDILRSEPQHAELSAFKHYFTAWQQCFNQMAAALAAVPDELKANCLAGIRAAIDQQAGMLN